MATSVGFDGKKEKNGFVLPERKAGGGMSSPLMGGLLPKLKKVSPNQISGLDNGDWQEFGRKK